MAMILDAFVDNCIDKLTSIVSEKVDMVMGVKDELRRLQRRLLRIKNFLEAAERRRLEDPNINHWVCELKDIAYDADDIIDRCIIQGDILLVDQPSSSKKTLVCFNFSPLSSCFTSIPHRYQITESIRSLNDRLEEISKDRLHFSLEESKEKQKSQTMKIVNARQTTPSVEYHLVGSEIEEATKGLVTLIVQDLMNKYRVYAITGMGGIGKTTLAQKIYNNNKIQIEFQTKVWVCISQIYNEIELLQRVIRGAGGHYGEAKTKAELEPLLQSTVKGKSLFLVLDDVWRADVWTSLFQNPLQSAGAIVRILVTTRDENVAMKMGAVDIHRVNQLSDPTSWEMLCRWVFMEGQENEIEILKNLGMKIVKKCAGLPLAIKAIAGVLATKERNIREWEKVLKNDAWTMSNLPEDLRGALYLSYDDLPSPLKQCFIYCSLFPEDKSIDRYALARLWVAEGFVKEQRDSLMEEVAEEYLNQLIRRNLLQSSHKDASICTMHDLLRSLAVFLSHDEIFSGDEMAATTTSSRKTKVRRLSIEYGKSIPDLVIGLMVEQKRLRTLLTFDDINDLNKFVGLKRLRVLTINSSYINSIPNSISDLLHLRYLNLRGTDIQELPESIGSLSNLQFLDIHGTFLRTLPKSITKLQNLRFLDVDYTSLRFIPEGISKLKNINELVGFVMANPKEPKGSFSSLEELNSLYNLRKLGIISSWSAHKGAAFIQKLTRLVTLKLEFRFSEEIEDVFEELCPPQCLNELIIMQFSGSRFPSWMQSPTFGEHLPSLTLLSLSSIFSCTQLPPAGELPQLSQLFISNADSVRRIGPEFLGFARDNTLTTTRAAFPNLQILHLHHMYNLEEWTFGNEVEGIEQAQALPKLILLPRLDELELNNCPKLEAPPRGLEKSNMKKLRIEMANSLRSVDNLPNVKEKLEIVRNLRLERVSHLPALRVLDIVNCPVLKCVEKLDSLQQLKLFDTSMEGLPPWLANLLEERKLDDDDDFIFECTCCEKAFTRMLKGGPDWSIIQSIPQVYVKVCDGPYFLRYTRKPFSYDTNINL